jgi:3-deoxy-D-manno-octulosonate 8-phosphate phosphatase (KDO 8-P phosphatase)
MNHFNSNYNDVIVKAGRIKLLLTDLDGTLTDGGIILDDIGMESKKFQLKDGKAVPLLRRSDIKTGVITRREVLCSR